MTWASIANPLYGVGLLGRDRLFTYRMPNCASARFSGIYQRSSYEKRRNR